MKTLRVLLIGLVVLCGVAAQADVNVIKKDGTKAAETFEKMGKRQDAIDNLRDMLRNERLQPLPEFQQAQRQLRDWGVGQG